MTMLFIITFFLIFGWKINNYIDISAFISVLLAVRYILKNRIKFDKYNNPAIISLFALATYSCIICLSTGLTDPYPILRSCRALIMLLAAFSLWDIYLQKNEDKNPTNILVKHIFYSLSLHSCIMAGMYFSDDFRLFIYSLTNAQDYVNNNSPFLEGNRICGLTYGLSQTSVLQMFSLLLFPYVFSLITNKKIKYLALCLIPILLISIQISGRSGLLIGILSIPAYLLLLVITNETTIKFNKQTIYSLLKYILIILMISTLAYSSLPKKYNYNNLQNLEIFEALNFKGHTAKLLTSTMYFLPDNIFTTIFGTGNYGRTQYMYLESDVGWIRTIFAIGIIGLVMMAFPFGFGIILAFQQIKKYPRLSIAIMLILVSSILLNFKELSLLTRNQWTIEAVLLAILIKNNQERLLNENTLSI